MDDPDEHEDEVLLIESNLDDMTPESLGPVLDRLLVAGALDAWFTPIQMKKGRPGVMLSLLCRPSDGKSLRDLVLQETSSLGVRWSTWRRQVAGRQSRQAPTAYGPVRFKLKILNGRVVGAKAEFEDCARLARDQGVPVLHVMDAARLAAAKMTSAEESAGEPLDQSRKA